MTGNKRKLLCVSLGRTTYKQAWELQKKLVDLRHSGEIPDVLLTTEHDPVITMGRASLPKNVLGSAEELKKRNVEIFVIERGGDVTFHGPGQLVIYPIIDLNNHGRDLHKYLRNLEQVIAAVLKEYGIDAGTKEGLTGVWAGDRKLAAIGVAVSRWITYHGAALNVNTDLGYFDLINPCGITEYEVGSMKSTTGNEIDMTKLTGKLEKSFADLFGYEIERAGSIDYLFPEPAETQ